MDCRMCWVELMALLLETGNGRAVLARRKPRVLRLILGAAPRPVKPAAGRPAYWLATRPSGRLKRS